MARRAKVKAGLRATRGSTRHVWSRIIVHRTAERKDAAFEACVRVGRNRSAKHGGQECAYGKNPRKAIANAMKKVARAIGSRSGAFAGV